MSEIQIHKYLIVLYAILICNYSSYAQDFEDVAASQGLLTNANGSILGCGVSFCDFNQDGWDDLSFGTDSDKLKLFQNVNGNFVQVETEFPSEDQITSVTWVDADNDGDLDLFYTCVNASPKFYENTGNLNLVEIIESTGIDQSINQETYGASWGDYDKDGFLDLYISNYNLESEPGEVTNRLYHNEGDLTFTDVTLDAGVDNGIQHTFNTIWIDYNLDSWPDLFVINDRYLFANALYENNGDGTFTDVAPDYGLDILILAMSASSADFDKDKDLDILVSNECAGNFFFENLNGTDFSNETESSNLITNHFCFGANWVDFDNDSWEDVYFSTTGCFAVEGTQNYAYRNNGDGSFTEINDEFPNNEYFQEVNAMGDYNNDGKADIVTNNSDFFRACLWKNITDNTNGYIKVALEGVVSNRDGVGSWISVYSNGSWQYRYTQLGEDYMSQDSRTEIFGIGDAGSIDSLKVEWPSGHIDTFINLEINQTLNIVEGSSLVANINSMSSTEFCFGDSVILNIVGEYENFEWNTGETTDSITVSSSGEYFITAYNEFGISFISPTIVTEMVEYPSYSTDFNDVTCFNLQNGSAEIINLDESQSIEVVWEDDINSLTRNDLDSGTHYFSISNSTGCLLNDSLEISQPDSLEISYGIQDFACEICPEEFIFETSGGTGEIETEVSEFITDSCAYTIILTDEVLCSTELLVALPLNEILEVDLAFTPWNSGAHVALIISGGMDPYSTLWSNGSVNTFEENYEEEGDYWVQIIDVNGCQIDVNFTVTDIYDFNLTANRLYPNPTSGNLFLSFSEQIDHVRIYDNQGRVVLEQYGLMEVIDVQSLLNGTYLIELTAENFRYRSLFIKE